MQETIREDIFEVVNIILQQKMDIINIISPIKINTIVDMCTFVIGILKEFHITKSSSFKEFNDVLIESDIESKIKKTALLAEMFDSLLDNMAIKFSFEEIENVICEISEILLSIIDRQNQHLKLRFSSFRKFDCTDDIIDIKKKIAIFEKRFYDLSNIVTISVGITKSKKNAQCSFISDR